MTKSAMVKTFLLSAAIFLVHSGWSQDLPAWGATLLGRTSKPDFNVFFPGQEIPIEFVVGGIAPGTTGLTLLIKVVDEHEDPIDAREIVDPSGESNWKTTYIAPNARLGFYRVYASLSTGETLPAMGSRKAGCLTYAIFPDPAGRTPYPPEEARFGMQGGFNGKLNVLPCLGANWANGPGMWKLAEPDHPGQFAQKRAAKISSGDWGPSKIPGATRGYDWAYVVRGGQNQAWPVYPVFSLANTPDWAGIPNHKSNYIAPLKPEAYDAWRDYCKAFAQSVVEDYPQLHIHFYQVTWEPNWFNGTDQQFYDIYRIAFDAIHEVDPNALVAGPTKSGVGDFGMRQEAALFDLGFGSKIDGYTIHPYIKMPAETHDYLNKLRLLMAFPSRRAGRAIPIYSTEQGEPTGQNQANDIKQARDLVRAGLMTLGEGVRFYFGFYVHDFKGGEGYGYFYNLRDDMIFGTDSISPKPIAPVFAAMTMLIDGHETVGPLDYMGDTALGYAFERKGDVVLALWDYGDTPRTVTIQAGVPGVLVYDWMGNQRQTKTVNGNLSLTLTREPTYVRGVAPALFGKESRRVIELATTSIVTMPGGQAVIEGTVRGPDGNAPDVELFIDRSAALGTKEQTQAISKASGAAPFRFRLDIPVTAPMGTYVVDLSARSGDAVMAARKIRIDVKPPVRIAAVTPSAIQVKPDGRLALQAVKASITNAQGQEVGASFVMDFGAVDQVAVKRAIRIEANADQAIDLPCSGVIFNPGESRAAALCGKTVGGFSFKEPLQLGLAVAHRVAAAPRIDADADEWASLPAHVLIDAGGRETGTVRFGWGEWGLALEAQIAGDAGRVSPELASLQIATNLDPSRIERSTGDVYNDALSLRRFQVLSLTESKDGSSAKRVFSFNRDLFHAGVLPPSVLPVRITRTDGKIVYRAIISWKQMAASTPCSQGDVIGISVAADVPVHQDFDFGSDDQPVSKLATPSTASLFGGISPKPDSYKLGYLLLAR